MSDVLQDIVAENAMPRKRYNHDCVDTGADFTLSDGVTTLFPCDCVLRDYKVDSKDIWFSSTSLLKDSVDDGNVFAEFNMIINGAISTIINFIFYIPHPTLGDIVVKTIPKKLYRNNTDEPIHFVTMLYNATDSDAKTYGFKVAIQADGSDCTLKARSILAITG